MPAPEAPAMQTNSPAPDAQRDIPKGVDLVPLGAGERPAKGIDFDEGRSVGCRMRGNRHDFAVHGARKALVRAFLARHMDVPPNSMAQAKRIGERKRDRAAMVAFERLSWWYPRRTLPYASSCGEPWQHIKNCLSGFHAGNRRSRSSPSEARGRRGWASRLVGGPNRVRGDARGDGKGRFARRRRHRIRRDRMASRASPRRIMKCRLARAGGNPQWRTPGVAHATRGASWLRTALRVVVRGLRVGAPSTTSPVASWPSRPVRWFEPAAAYPRGTVDSGLRTLSR